MCNSIGQQWARAFLSHLPKKNNLNYKLSNQHKKLSNQHNKLSNQDNKFSNQDNSPAPKVGNQRDHRFVGDYYWITKIQLYKYVILYLNDVQHCIGCILIPLLMKNFHMGDWDDLLNIWGGACRVVKEGNLRCKSDIIHVSTALLTAHWAVLAEHAGIFNDPALSSLSIGFEGHDSWSWKSVQIYVIEKLLPTWLVLEIFNGHN